MALETFRGLPETHSGQNVAPSMFAQRQYLKQPKNDENMHAVYSKMRVINWNWSCHFPSRLCNGHDPSEGAETQREEEAMSRSE